MAAQEALSKLTLSPHSSFTPTTSVLINLPAANRHQTAKRTGDLLAVITSLSNKQLGD
jgi:hypothetical protein